MAVFRYKLHIWRDKDENNSPINIAYFFPTRQFFKGDILKITGEVEAMLEKAILNKENFINIFFNKTPFMYNQKKEEYSLQDLTLLETFKTKDSYKVMILKNKKIKQLRSSKKK
jgi:hypothetical protein